MSSVISVLKLRLLRNVLSPNLDELGTSKYPIEGVLSIDSAGGGFVKAKIRIEQLESKAPQPQAPNNKVTFEEAGSFKYVYILVDTGNRARSCIDESVLKTLHPGHEPELENVNTLLSTAASGQSLEVLGRTKNFIELKFYNPKTQDHIVYKVRPMVVRNLSLPFVISLYDLKKMKAEVRCHLDDVIFNTNSGPVFVKMTPLPGQEYNAFIKRKITVAANSEIVTSIGVTNQHHLVGRDLVFQPGEMLDQSDLISSATISRMRSYDPGIYMRVMNLNAHPVTLKAGTIVGTAQDFGTEGFQWNSKIVGLIDPAKETKRTTRSSTRQELYNELWTQLGFDKPNALTESEKRDIVRLFAAHRNALAMRPEDVGHTSKVRIAINTGDSKPIRVKCRPLPPHLLEALKEQIAKWLSQKVISPCNGPWASPLVPVRKPNGTYRFAVDYRALNMVTAKDSRPVARKTQ